MTDGLTTLASTYFGDSTDSGAQNMTATPTALTDSCSTTTTPPPVKNTATGSMAGLTTGSPTLHLHISTGTAFNKVTIGLPGGLKFVKASAKTLAKEVSGGVKSAKLSGGKLVLTLKSKGKSATLTTKKGLISESASLIKSIKKHKTKTLNVTVKAGTIALKAKIKA